MASSPLNWLVGLMIPVLVAIINWYLIQNCYVEQICCMDLELATERCRMQCPHGYFSLVDMKECLPWLTCADIAAISLRHVIGGGAVKMV